ncbi:A/G-specific adenine glycosylase [Mariniplasma anaerobium]|uniref:Adenine DNA glycosylase n=1 Tax=Mariniplasma anaerobium TaxID=2735436 RepID=A0A7U9TID6_9MOLU|nr:A/G-specific adenine glycosylase [Mariniplasma anaerobium]BCR35930.1 adenine DNA glycosylase [Mariniplasma anaerobium]
MDIKKLEAWYESNHRKLLFRETSDPYKIWVSEIMLQQTQVETVLPFFKSFIKKYPTVERLAKTDQETLKKDVEGLGYYRRFKYMLLAAKQIVDKNSGFPSKYQDVLALPGVGKYTAGAIMSIAYNEPYSALDGNVIRVLSRYLNLNDDFRVEKNKKNLDQINQEIIESARPRIYTQSLMELGALICRPKNPKCEICPLNEHCIAYELNIQETLPVMAKLKDKKEFNYITLKLYDKNDQIVLRKRTESLLEGMYEYPQFESESIFDVISTLESNGVVIDVINKEMNYKHIFTHQIWYMKVFEARLLKGKDLSWMMVDKEKIKQLPMAVAHRKIK